MKKRNTCRWTVCAALGLMGLAGLASRASAQCAAYEITQVSGAPYTPGTTDANIHYDDGTVAVSMPFAVNYYGTSYSTAYVCSNGWMSFSSTAGQGYNNVCLPGGSPASYTAVPGPSLFPFWDDLYTADTANGEGVFTATTGAAPNRQFIIEWRAVYCCTGGAPVNNFEVIFYENAGGFDFVYGGMADRGSATIGVQQDGTAGSAFTQFSCNTAQSLQGTLLHFDCGSGSCCFVDGTCQVLSRGACGTQGGLYAGDNTTCGANCQRPGACCMPDGSCSLTSSALCASAGGLYAGDGVTCAGAGCAPGGSCCLPSGTCQVLTSGLCAAQNGIWGGANTSCTGVSCTGRCCLTDGTCQVTSQQHCAGVGGSYSSGVNTCAGTYGMTAGTTAIEDIGATGALVFSSPADNGGVALNPTTGSLDDGSTFITLPFTFNFYGNPYTQAQVGTNGYITFDPTVGNGSYWESSGGIPNTAAPNNMICAPWCDFYLFNAGHCGFQVNGAAPNRRAIVQWTGVQYYNGTGVYTATSTFQVIMYETSNNVEVRIQTIGNTPPLTNVPKVLGLENIDGTSAVAVPWPGDTAAAGTSYVFMYSSGCPTNTTGSCCTANMCTITTQTACSGTWTAGGVCPDTCGHHCGSADFNCDGATGTDADIESFFSCLSGTCPPLPCTSNSDFNGDGAAGTDADIEAFFRVLSGGSC
jgi:hypothetical protein